MSGQVTATAFVKSAFYKTCFCIGLGTASYYSYAQVQNWVSDKSAAQAQDSTLQEKVNSLVSFGSASGTTTTAQAVMQNPTSQGLNVVRANPKGYLTLDPSAPKKEEAPVAVAAADASPSPAASASPSPGEATAEKKEGEGAEKKEGEENKEELAQQAVTGPVNEVGLPYSPYAVQQPNKAPDAPNNAAISPEAQTQAAASYGGGIPTPGTPGAGTAGNSGSGSGTSGGNNTYTGGGGTVYTSPATGSGSSSFLSAADLAILTAPIKATLADQTQSVAGTVCQILSEENQTVRDCVRNNNFSLHTNHWSTSYGVMSESGFTVRASSSGSSQIKVTVNLKLQDLSQNYQDVSLDAYPTEVLVHTESRSGGLYRVYELKLPDLTMTGGKLTNLTATLVYSETSAAGAGAVMTTDSSLTFTRAQVNTTGSIWDLTGPNRVPAANELVITADSINYSMSLEKSP